MNLSDLMEYELSDRSLIEEWLGDTEYDVASGLARLFSNLDGACKGKQYNLDGMTTAVHQMREDYIAWLQKDEGPDEEEELRRLDYRQRVRELG